MKAQDIDVRIINLLSACDGTAQELADSIVEPLTVIYQHLASLEASGHVSVWVRKKAGHRIALWQLER
jgi:hypothetical protein